MKYKMGLGILFVVLFGLFISPGGAVEDNVFIYLRGEEIKLTLSNENGRFYGLRQEMIRLVPELDISPAAENDQQELNRVPLRAFWEKAGFQVKWFPELKTIIISENKQTFSLPSGILAMVGQAVADVDWMKYKREEDLKAHLSRFYTPETVEKLLPETLDFVNLETDWHSLWTLVDGEVIDGGENWYLLKVTVSEKSDPFSTPVMIPGIIKLRQVESGWRIDSYRYLDNEE